MGGCYVGLYIVYIGRVYVGGTYTLYIRLRSVYVCVYIVYMYPLRMYSVHVRIYIAYIGRVYAGGTYTLYIRKYAYIYYYTHREKEAK